MAEFEGGGPSPVAETVFTVLPSARKVCSLLDSMLNIYDPVLAGHCSAPVSQPKPPTAPVSLSLGNLKLCLFLAQSSSHASQGSGSIQLNVGATSD